ncbi:MAG: YraN family protein [Propionibacterium acidifaciens]
MSTRSTGRGTTGASRGAAPVGARRPGGGRTDGGPAGRRAATKGPPERGTAASGRRGEALAAEHLERLGWRVLDRNWRCSAGEIDLVAHDPLEDALVFVEVKYRTGTGYGAPLEAITYAKRMHLRAVAAVWLREHGMSLPVGTRVRIDGLGIVKLPGRRAEFTHVRGLS